LTNASSINHLLNSPVRLAGAEPAWDALGLLDPQVVCRRTGAIFDGIAQAFRLKFFSQYVDVSLNSKFISSPERDGELLLEILSNYATPAILSYLLHASDNPFSGKFVNPAALTGGQIYTGGTHVLPVQLIADKYRTDREEFLNRGRILGGRELDLAEASLLLHPFPRLAIAILLWLQDNEFPARSVLLVDSSAEQQLPPDALWVTAMMSLTALL
jgi:hypothetical protein